MIKRWCGLSVPMLLSGLAFGGWTHWKMVRGPLREAHHLRAEARSMEATRSDLIVARRMEELKSAQTGLETRIPSNAGVADVVERLQRDIDDLDIRGCTWNIGAPEHGEIVTSTPLELGFSTTYAGVYEFVSRIARYPRAVRVDALMMQAQTKTPDNSITVSMRLHILSRTERAMFEWETMPND